LREDNSLLLSLLVILKKVIEDMRETHLHKNFDRRILCGY